MQDYIWNKGTRCDWAITEFQVMCVVIGVASFVLILLFMIIVFFAKRLHHLKNENKRLRKRRCVGVSLGDARGEKKGVLREVAVTVSDLV